jgi:hypothetical protein
MLMVYDNCQLPSTRNAVDSLSNDVLADIFCYLPSRSLCYCKRVIFDSYHYKNLSQTVIGFFHGS